MVGWHYAVPGHDSSDQAVLGGMAAASPQSVGSRYPWRASFRRGPPRHAI